MVEQFLGVDRVHGCWGTGNSCRNLGRLGCQRAEQWNGRVGLSVLNILVEMSDEFAPFTAYEENAKNDDEDDGHR
jgi:hypothetical protein